MVAREPLRRPGCPDPCWGTLAGVDHVLATERLVLRPVTAGGRAVLLAHWTLPDVRRFLFDGQAPPAAEVTATIAERPTTSAAAPPRARPIEPPAAPAPRGTAA